MKKFLVLLVSLLLLFMGLYAHASWDSTLDKINNVMNKVDRTEYTINRVKNRIPTPPTTSYPKTQTTTTPSNQSTNTNRTYSGGSQYDSGNQYQYQNTEYDNMPAQQQTEGQDPSMQQGQQYSQDRVFKGQVSTLGELPAGAIVMDPKSVWNFRTGYNYSGGIELSWPVFYKKLEDNHYADGSTLLLSIENVALYPFCHDKKGIRAWDESDIRRFLRTTFYNHLSEGFKNAIVNVNIPFADLNGNPKTVNDNFFLLSIVEWGLSDRANNGSVIKYNDIPNLYSSVDMEFVKSWDSYRIDTNHHDNMTRTINRPKATSAGYDEDIFIVTKKGVLETVPYRFYFYAIRPAVNLKSSTKVSGPYELKYHVSKSKSLIYYALEL